MERLSLKTIFWGVFLLPLWLTAPLMADERPWTMFLFEEKAAPEHGPVMIGLIKGLTGLNRLRPGPLPESPLSAKEAWSWLAAEERANPGLIIPADGFQSDAKLKLLAERLGGPGHRYLVLALAGPDKAVHLAKLNPHATIIGLDLDGRTLATEQLPANLHFLEIADSTGRQIEAFHHLFGFKTLGVMSAVPDGPDGVFTERRRQIIALGEETGFEAVFCPDPADQAACLNYLSDNSQAVFLAAAAELPPEKLPNLLKPVLEKRLPTFSQKGTDETSLGALLSVSHRNFEDLGYFEAGVIDAVISGGAPAEIRTFYAPPLGLALNISTALAIGWNPPLEVLAMVDEIYQGGLK
ncbi:hypothetical protein C4J81_17775 [Deltaproteobacteria bacterium Smac51]|nr:hypothetical protein C4J81_17775 [Deltaproteobacteria bacterium Smac51]